MLRSLNELRGYTLSTSDGDLGSVRDFYVDDRHWLIRYLVANTGTWLPGRQVLISPVSILDADWASRRIKVRLTKAQVKESPGIEADAPITRQFELELTRYFDWPVYWISGPYPAMAAGAVEAAEAQRRQREANVEVKSDPHLFSVRDVSGYHIHAADGEIGHVDDFIVDDGPWALRYAVVDTRNWMPGRKVLVATNWVKSINWQEKQVSVSLDRNSIRESPAYHPSEPINREYEVKLYDYYGRPRYWER